MKIAIACGILLLVNIAVAEEPAKLAPKTQAKLLQMAKRWGVPQPNEKSTVWKIWVFRQGADKDARDKYALGFVEPDKPGWALVGFDLWDMARRPDTKAVAEPAELSLEDISPTSPFDGHGVNFGLVTGIQLIRRGDEKLGVALIEKALGAESGHHRSPFRTSAGEPPVLMLARSCLAAAINEITSSKPNFVEIKQRIEKLLADQPELKSESTDWVLESLAANVAHKAPQTGSIEQIIDDYLVGGGKHGAFRFHSGELPTAERALILKGFEAVPALLEQRHSNRFSNHLMQGFNNFVSYPMSAGQVIDGYLQRLANDELDTDWLERQQGHTADEDAVLTWWKQASALGEEAYVKTHTVVVDADDNIQLSNELLLIAQHRYPAFLPDFYRKLLATSESSWPVADAIMESEGIANAEKVELLQAAIATNDSAHRNRAVEHLRDLDQVLADEVLLALLNKAPNTTDGKYWIDQDAGLGRLVSTSRSLEVWQAMHAFLDRADLGMRMELIDNLMPPRDAPPDILRSFHEVYVRYGEDETIRDNSTSEKFSGPGAGFPHKQIEMRDFVHMHWGRWLELKLKDPEAPASPADWKTFREIVGMIVEQSYEKDSDGIEKDRRQK